MDAKDTLATTENAVKFASAVVGKPSHDWSSYYHKGLITHKGSFT